MKKSFGYFLN